ncbi:hypothetical protein Moror_3955 [Moniliophthora roreri MCA 2997]|uniref:Uncharacterized protein n=1 Tax=Moniliophthora roreri (strain MCA 2997) TaxID=1381753 RepID=V2XNG0_MONRO|nr:hypothetical protein Moror_3955 [Moniliophthora roreri MCA 2997]
MNSAGPTNSYPSNRVEESHPNVVRNVDDLSRADFSNGQLVSAPNSGYGQSVFNNYCASYGVGSHDYMNAATGPSFPDSNHQYLETEAYRGESPLAANAARSSHIPAGTTRSCSDSGYRYDTTYPLSTTNDTAESVLVPNGQPCVIKQVIATGGVVDASM